MQSSEKTTETTDSLVRFYGSFTVIPEGFVFFFFFCVGAGSQQWGENSVQSSPVNEALTPGPSHLATVSHSCNSYQNNVNYEPCFCKSKSNK